MWLIVTTFFDFKLFTYAFAKDPLAKALDVRSLTGAGVSQPDALPSMGPDGSFWGGNEQRLVRYRETQDFIDLSTVSNRMSRYKEYERLRNVAEIEMAMTVFADEACVAGATEIATPFGFPTIEWLAKNKPEEKFLVYAWDFAKQDYTLAWGFNPRKTKTASTIKVMLEDGSSFIVTPDHRVLLRTSEWASAGSLKFGDELMPFYRLKADQNHTKLKTGQFPRIFTHQNGWMHERQFVDEWRSGRKEERFERIGKIIKAVTAGMPMKDIRKYVNKDWKTIQSTIGREGFSLQELRQLSKKPDRRRVVGMYQDKTIDVYDLSVEDHKNFCSKSVIFHNCQKDENGHIFKIECANKQVKEELEFLFFHRMMLNMDRRTWSDFKNLCIFGDTFYELVINPDEPKDGVMKIVRLPPESVYRIETTKGKVVEFQQSKEGPDYQSLVRAPVVQATDAEIQQATAIRFTPEQIIHIRIGDDRKTFYPYGVSLVEAARGPAHQLRLMEDSMVVYRLCIRSYDKVNCRKSWKYMKDITCQDIVWAYNKDMHKLEETKVAWHGKVGHMPTFKVRSKHTSVTGTDIHPILVRDSKTEVIDYVRIKDIKPKRHQFLRPIVENNTPNKIERFYKPIYARLSKKQKELYKRKNIEDKKSLIVSCLQSLNLQADKKNVQSCWTFLVSKDNVSLPVERATSLCEAFDLNVCELIHHHRYEKNPERINLPSYVDKDFAELFGFLLGDGCVSYHKASAKLLFAAGEYPQLNKKYQNLLKLYFGECRFQQDKRIRDGLGCYCTNSITACDILTNLGFGKDCYTKRIPEWVFQERKEIRKAIIVGLADAEGTKRDMVLCPWRTTIRLTNKELVEDIKFLWEGLGYHASEVKKIDEPEKILKGKIIPAGTSWEIYISENKVPLYDEIVAVESAGDEDVYDLTVEHKDHNFLCNGVPVANTRAPERRVFYIDVGQLPPFKAEAFIERMKDQFRKKKTASSRGSQYGAASVVEERWHAPAADEDYWLPIRPNSQTKIDTLPGAQNLGEIDDAVYFRNKLFAALNFPKNYFNNEDPNATRITLSAQDIKFARMIERLQSHQEDGLWEIADRHLQLRGFPEESYDDLRIKMTPPSDWRELSRAEVTTNRINNASSLKSSQLMADWDIQTRWMKYSEDETEEMLARLKIQKLEDLKLQVLAQNPQLIGVGIPGQTPQPGQEIGAEAGGPNPMLGPPGAEGQPGMPPPEQPPPEQPPPEQGGVPPGPKPMEGAPLSEPNEEDIKKYDLELQDYEAEMDEENPDYSIGGG